MQSATYLRPLPHCSYLSHPMILYAAEVVNASFENWAMSVFRGGKCHAAALFCVRVEVFINDDGATGNNGKTFLQAVMEQTFGDYATQIKETMLTRPPPSASSPDPALLKLKGSRGLGTPEVEATLKIQSAWLKKLADPSTQWAARAPHDVRDTIFQLFSMFFVSTNCKIAFSKVDGGIVRRAICVPYEFHFCSSPQQPHERPAHPEDIKSKAWLQPRIPGWLYFLMAVNRVIFEGSNMQPRLMPWPKAVQVATEKAMASEHVESVKIYINEYLQTVTSAAEATTKTKLLKQLRTEPSLRNQSTEDFVVADDDVDDNVDDNDDDDVDNDDNDDVDDDVDDNDAFDDDVDDDLDDDDHDDDNDDNDDDDQAS